MKIVGLMLVRNEDWILEASIDAALQWCDKVVVLMDRCSDNTGQIASKFGGQVFRVVVNEGRHWEEMDLRERTLHAGRHLGGTHFAVVDADEILTHNYLPMVREWFGRLEPGELLELPMLPVYDDLDHIRTDEPWYSAWLTLGFADAPGLTWRPADDGYQHHHRAPHGVSGQRLRPVMRGFGGVMHLQFANVRRLLAKHVLYRMVDHLRWPNRESVEKLNAKYDQALRRPQYVIDVPPAYWGNYRKPSIHLSGIPYQEHEIQRLLSEHGREAFEGLDLKGF